MINLRKALIMLSTNIALAAFLAKMLQWELVVTLLFALSFVCVLLTYVLVIVERQRIKAVDILMVSIMALSVTTAGLQTSFDYYKPAIIVFCTIICLDMSIFDLTDAIDRKKLLYRFALVAIVINVLYHFGGLKEVYYGTTEAITLNLTNPNETGMWLACLVVILINGAFETVRRVDKIIFVACAVSLIPILFRTLARASLIAVLIFVIIRGVLLFKKINRLPGWVISIFAVSPIIAYVAYMYIFMPNFSMLSEWFAFWRWEGKGLDSRFWIWSLIERDARECMWLGQYDVYHTEQLHNALGTLFVRFGLPFVIIVCRKFCRAVKQYADVIPQITMCCMWLIGCFETAFFTGANGLYLLILILPVFGYKRVREESVPTTKKFVLKQGKSLAESSCK